MCLTAPLPPHLSHKSKSKTPHLLYWASFNARNLTETSPSPFQTKWPRNTRVTPSNVFVSHATFASPFLYHARGLQAVERHDLLPYAPHRSNLRFIFKPTPHLDYHSVFWLKCLIPSWISPFWFFLLIPSWFWTDMSAIRIQKCLSPPFLKTTVGATPDTPPSPVKSASPLNIA